MGDKNKPPTSARSARSASSTQSRRAPPTVATNGKTKPFIKTAATTSGGKNLLPSKMKPLSTATEGPVRPRVIPLVSTKKCEVTRQKNDLYDLYLLNMVHTGFIKDMESLQHDDHVEGGMTKVIDMIADTRSMVKVFANKVVLRMWDDLKQLDIIAAAFENLVDFTGEETLAEIQTLLMKKYEKITVTGAVMKEPIFHGVEMEQILNRVRTHLTGKIEDEKVIGFVKIFSDALNKLTAAAENTENTIERLQQENKIVLEHCSVTACNKGWESFHAKKAKEEAECQNEETKVEKGSGEGEGEGEGEEDLADED